MFGADARVCSFTRVRLWGRLEAYGVGGTTLTGRCEGVFVGSGGGGSAMWGGWVCDVVVTPGVLRSLEMARPRTATRLLRCPD